MGGDKGEFSMEWPFAEEPASLVCHPHSSSFTLGVHTQLDALWNSILPNFPQHIQLRADSCLLCWRVRLSFSALPYISPKPQAVSRGQRDRITLRFLGLQFLQKAFLPWGLGASPAVPAITSIQVHGMLGDFLVFHGQNFSPFHKVLFCKAFDNPLCSFTFQKFVHVFVMSLPPFLFFVFYTLLNLLLLFFLQLCRANPGPLTW
jgi:hypothetical protein